MDNKKDAISCYYSVNSFYQTSTSLICVYLINGSLPLSCNSSE